MSNDAGFTVGISAQSLSTVNGGDVSSARNVSAAGNSTAGNDIAAGRNIIATGYIQAATAKLAWTNFASLPTAPDGTVRLILDASIDDSGVITGGGTSKAMGAAYGGQWYAV
jgi:hypothetical protein